MEKSGDSTGKRGCGMKQNDGCGDLPEYKITDFQVDELLSYTEQDFLEISELIKVLSPRCDFDNDSLARVLADTSSHLYVMRHLRETPTAPNVTVRDKCGSPLDANRIVGCCTICIFASPTGIKASIEDVVVHPAFQGNGLGRLLVESAMRKARAFVSEKSRAEGFKMKAQDLHLYAYYRGWNPPKLHFQPPIHFQLTSKPEREAANALYRSMGFEQKETNVYILDM